MQINILNNALENRLEARLGGGLAWLSYRIEHGRMEVLYVEVPPAQRGRGIGGQLAEAALAMAKAQEWEVIPVCGFMADYMQHHPS